MTPGETVPVLVSLSLTRQRLLSYGVFAGGAAAILSGAALSLVALDAEHTARQVLTAASAGPLQQSDLDRYNGALSRRDDTRTAALSLLGAGVALGLTGAALYFFDNPDPPKMRAANEAKQVSVAVAITPFCAGVGITGSF